MKISALFLVVVIAAPVALAQTGKWTGPDASRAPRKGGDFEFALSEVCFPFVSGQQTIDQIGARQNIKINKAKSGAGGVVMIRNEMTVLLGESADGARSCSTEYSGGDLAQTVATIRARLAQWPAGLTLAKGQRTDTNFFAYEHYCSPAEGVQDHAEIVAGGSLKALKKRTSLTLSRGGQRSVSCDSETPYSPLQKVE